MKIRSPVHTFAPQVGSEASHQKQPSDFPPITLHFEKKRWFGEPGVEAHVSLLAHLPAQSPFDNTVAAGPF